jgi:hypothetical protein
MVEKAAIFKFGEFDTTDWAAINTGGADADEKPAIKACIMRFECLVAG